MKCDKCANYEPVGVDRYRSKSRPYDIELTRDGATVTARVWDMPEEVRPIRGNLDTKVSSGSYRIRAGNGPQIGRGVLWLRGCFKTEDNNVANYIFPTVEAARDYFKHITALIDKLNAEYELSTTSQGRINARALAEQLVFDWLCSVEKTECFTLSAHRKEALICSIYDELITKNQLNMEYKPAFDAEKVRELIKELATAYITEGAILKDDLSNYVSLRDASLEARRNLLTALGLDDA